MYVKGTLSLLPAVCSLDNYNKLYNIITVQQHLIYTIIQLQTPDDELVGLL